MLPHEYPPVVVPASQLNSAAVISCPLSGRVLLEALLSGRPVVAYDVEWHAEVVRDGETGVLVSYRDARAMGQAIARLVREPAEARRLGDRAREATLAYADPDAVAQEKRRAYTSLLSLGPGQPLAEATPRAPRMILKSSRPS